MDSFWVAPDADAAFTFAGFAFGEVMPSAVRVFQLLTVPFGRLYSFATCETDWPARRAVMTAARTSALRATGRFGMDAVCRIQRGESLVAR